MNFTYQYTKQIRGVKYDLFKGTVKGCEVWQRSTTFKNEFGMYPDTLFWFSSLKVMTKFLGL